MQKILEFIVNHFSFLWAPHTYSIVDSTCSGYGEGDAYVTIVSEDLRLFFTYDRSQLLLTVGPVKGSLDKLVDIDHIYELRTGQYFEKTLLRPEYADFLRDNHEWVKNLFTDEHIKETHAQLSKLYQKRKGEGRGL